MSLPQQDRLIAGRFRVRGQLGIGTLGWLYQAFDPERDCEVALRVVTGAQSLLDARDRLAEHFAHLGTIAGPSIAAVYDCGVADGQLWFTSEIISGVSLEKKVTLDGALGSAEAARIAAAVAGSLVGAHAHGLIHKDLKVRNVFLAGERAVLTELGVAATVLTGPASSLVNTPGSAAPELLLGCRVDHRADIYSLGACLWHLVVGEPAFKGGSGDQVFAAHLGWRAPRPTDFRKTVPEGLELIILKAMAAQAEDRFQSMSDLSGALLDWCRREER